MTESSLFRTGAVLFGLSGAVNMVADLLPGTVWLNVLGVAVGILGLPAIYLAQWRETGSQGLIAALLAGLGLIGIAGFLFVDATVLPNLPAETGAALMGGPAGAAIFAAVILYVLGVVGFAAANWRGAVLPRTALALWAIGTAPTIAAVALPSVVMTVAEIVAGAGVVWLAVAVFRAAPGLNAGTSVAGAQPSDNTWKR
jgi:hypothetical protein